MNIGSNHIRSFDEPADEAWRFAGKSQYQVKMIYEISIIQTNQNLAALIVGWCRAR